jgi:hypothetical protein
MRHANFAKTAASVTVLNAMSRNKTKIDEFLDVGEDVIFHID